MHYGANRKIFVEYMLMNITKTYARIVVYIIGYAKSISRITTKPLIE
jgi:hypothetical protein